VARAIREEVSRIILDELADPRLGFVTVTRVEPAPDLSVARIFISVLGAEADQRKTFRALAHCRGRVQALVGKRLRLRYVPELSFVEDDTIARAARIEELIRRARATDRDAASPGDEAPESS